MSAAEQKDKFSEEDLCCPLTSGLFHNPVTLSCHDKHVFEEEAIIKQAQEGVTGTCPTCREPLAYYKENAELKAAVEAYIKSDPAQEDERRKDQYKLGTTFKPSRPIQRAVSHKEGQATDERWYTFAVYAEAAEHLRAGRRLVAVLPALILLIILFLLFIFSLAALGFGIYLSTLLTPVISGALLALGIAPVFAWMLGVLGGLALVFATSALLVPGGFLSQITLNWITKKGGWAAWYFLVFLTGIGFGIYLSVLVGPLVISALVATGISSGLAGFIVAAMSLLLIRATIDWLDLLVFCFGIQGMARKEGDDERFLNALPVVLFEFWQTLKFTWERDRWLGVGYGLGWCAGLALSIYLCIWVAPFIVDALVLTGASSGVITCLLVIIGLALTTALVRLAPILLNLPIYLGKYVAERNAFRRSTLMVSMGIIVNPWMGSVKALQQAQELDARQEGGRGVHGPLRADHLFPPQAQGLAEGSIMRGDPALAAQLQREELEAAGVVV